MTKQILAIAVLCIGAALVLTTPAHADIISTTNSYDSPEGYDYVTTFPPTGSTTIGTFTFTIPAGENVTNITVSGSFGNSDVPVTALSDYYVGIPGGDETAVEVAACDSPSADCYSNQNANNSWSVTLTPAQIADLANGLAQGKIDFTYTWDSGAPPIPDGFSPTGFDDQFVYAGPATLDITTPEPATALLCFSGVASLAAFRRFRKP